MTITRCSCHCPRERCLQHQLGSSIHPSEAARPLPWARSIVCSTRPGKKQPEQDDIGELLAGLQRRQFTLKLTPANTLLGLLHLQPERRGEMASEFRRTKQSNSLDGLFTQVLISRLFRTDLKCAASTGVPSDFPFADLNPSN
jgi:hypothetical protein